MLLAFAGPLLVHSGPFGPLDHPATGPLGPPSKSPELRMHIKFQTIWSPGPFFRGPLWTTLDHFGPLGPKVNRCKKRIQ